MARKFLVHLCSAVSGQAYGVLGVSLQKDFERIAEIHSFVRWHVATLPTSSRFKGSWQKIPFMLRKLSDERVAEGDWLVWVDADVMVVDHHFDPAAILRKNKRLVLSVDMHGICFGVFAVCKCDWSRALFRTLLLLGNIDSARQAEFDKSPRMEQDTVKCLLRYFPSFRRHIGIIPEHVVQNRKSIYSSTAWMYHFWMEGRSQREILRKRAMVNREGWTEDVFRSMGRFTNQTWKNVENVAGRLGTSPSVVGEFVTGRRIAEGQRSRTIVRGKESDILLRLADLADYASVTLPGKLDAQRWLNSKSRILGGKTPIESAGLGVRFDRVMRMLDRIYGSRTKRALRG